MVGILNYVVGLTINLSRLDGRHSNTTSALAAYLLQYSYSGNTMF